MVGRGSRKSKQRKLDYINKSLKGCKAHHTGPLGEDVRAAEDQKVAVARPLRPQTMALTGILSGDAVQGKGTVWSCLL